MRMRYPGDSIGFLGATKSSHPTLNLGKCIGTKVITRVETASSLTVSLIHFSTPALLRLQEEGPTVPQSQCATYHQLPMDFLRSKSRIPLGMAFAVIMEVAIIESTLEPILSSQVVAIPLVIMEARLKRDICTALHQARITRTDKVLVSSLMLSSLPARANTILDWTPHLTTKVTDLGVP
jgi:hypothetical protein